VYSLILYVM